LLAWSIAYCIHLENLAVIPPTRVGDKVRVLFIGFQDLVHPWYDDFLEAVAGRFPVELYDTNRSFSDQLGGVEVVVDQGGWGTRAMADAAAAAGVKLWQVIGTGLDHIDIKYFTDRGLPVCYSPGVLSGIGLAEHALMLMLCLVKNWSVTQKNVHSGVWYHPMTEELQGKNLGLVGFGGSARELAVRAWAMGMRISAIDVVDVPASVLADCRLSFFGGVQDLPKLLAESDFLSLHVPLTRQTTHLIDRSAFALMKQTAFLINVARGEIVEEAALLEALRSGQIRGAGLDTFAGEPLKPDHPLLQLPNVIATPHIAGGTRGTSRRRGQSAAENVARVAAGQEPLYPAKPK
jgi:phosphoglycerate dehydrogenase-like enzyme